MATYTHLVSTSEFGQAPQQREGRLGFRAGYFWVSLAVFAIEVLIATVGAQQPFLRGYVGDALVVVLIYTLISAFWRVHRRQLLALSVFGLACLVEVFQYLGGSELLRLADGSWQQVVVGTTFSWGDIAAYAVGCLLVWSADVALRRRAN